jgi:glutamate/tyrosine decarboxylase-like PLP-dependent enzyme
MEEVKLPGEESLDPQDWEEMQELAHQMVDDMMGHLRTVRERPIWQKPPQDMREFLRQPVPQAGMATDQIYAEFRQNILPYQMGNIHPRFWGWVIGTGTPFGMLAEMLAATMNSNAGGGDHVAPLMEAQIIEWLKEIMGFPASASGLLVSGGSMANLNALAVARNIMAGFDIRREGLQKIDQPMVLYGSVETHSSVQKAAELMGLGDQFYRKIPVNAAYEIEIEALKAAIAADKTAGLHPFCIVGNAGTVNTGAFDDLNALADIARQEKMWLHVDGAFGALAILAPKMKHRLKGMERADSLAFDLHKWMYMPYEIGCTLVRVEENHRHAFSLTPTYLAHSDRGMHAGATWFSDYGVQLSRGFKALKAWMSIKEHGVEKYGRLIQQNIDQAAYLAGLVEAAPELELLAPVPLNIVCFRYVKAGLDDQALNKLNEEILIQLHERAIAVPS